MSSQAHNPAVCARPLAEKREHRSHQKGQNHSGDGSRKQQRRVAELRISGARHHPADLPEAAIGPQAPGAPGQTEPDRALGLEAAGEGAIVDDLGPDGGDAAGPLQRLAPHQHAAAGRRGELALPLRHPGEGIEHLKEEDESRNRGNAPPNACTTIAPSARAGTRLRARHARRAPEDCRAHGRCRRRSTAGSQAPRRKPWRDRRPAAGPTPCRSIPWAGACRAGLRGARRLPGRRPPSGQRRPCRHRCRHPPARCGRNRDNPAAAGFRSNARSRPLRCGRARRPPRPASGRAGEGLAGHRARASARIRRGRPASRARPPARERPGPSPGSCRGTLPSGTMPAHRPRPR